MWDYFWGVFLSFVVFNVIQNYLFFPLKNELLKTWEKDRASFKIGCRNVFFFNWYLMLATLSCIFTIIPNNSNTENLATISCLIREYKRKALNNPVLKKKTLYSLIFMDDFHQYYHFNISQSCWIEDSLITGTALPSKVFTKFIWLAALPLIPFSHLLP